MTCNGGCGDSSIGCGDLKSSPPDVNVSTSRKPCSRCGAASDVSIGQYGARCRRCFLLACTKEFRSIIGKARANRPAETVLICCSGGSSSTALLHLVTEGMKAKRLFSYCRLVFRPQVLYIDEGGALDSTTRLEDARIVVDLVRRFHLPTSVAVLESDFEVDVADDSSWMAPMKEAISRTANLSTTLSECESLTTQEQLLSVRRQRLIGRIAERRQIKHVLLGDNSTKLAIDLLVSTSLGRGQNASLDTSEIDGRNCGVRLLRPMRSISAKDAALYNHFSGNVCHTVRNLSTGAPPDSSLRRCTEEFLCGIIDEFPQTADVLLRIGGKLSTTSASGETSDSRRCSSCLGVANHALLSSLCHSCSVFPPSAVTDGEPVECDSDQARC